MTEKPGFFDVDHDLAFVVVVVAGDAADAGDAVDAPAAADDDVGVEETGGTAVKPPLPLLVGVELVFPPNMARRSAIDLPDPLSICVLCCAMRLW